jgi:sigma-B regulation protein RsbU (phosphoserine phosphatase)
VPALAERIRLKQSLGLAHEVQQTFLPTRPPRREGIDTAAVVAYSEETGGDFYDVIEPHGEDTACIGALVADVSGHGMPAALLMASTRAFLRARFLDKGPANDIAEAVSAANRLLFKDEAGSGRFVTLFYLEVDLETNVMSWVRAGHLPALIYDIAEDTFGELEGPPGLALGVDPDTRYETFTAGCLCSGQVAVLYTDGLVETVNEAGEFFGRERMYECIRKAASGSAAGITECLLEEAEAFRGDTPQDDDITIVVLKIQGTAETSEA